MCPHQHKPSSVSRWWQDRAFKTIKDKNNIRARLRTWNTGNHDDHRTKKKEKEIAFHEGHVLKGQSTKFLILSLLTDHLPSPMYISKSERYVFDEWIVQWMRFLLGGFMQSPMSMYRCGSVRSDVSHRSVLKTVLSITFISDRHNETECTHSIGWAPNWVVQLRSLKDRMPCKGTLTNSRGRPMGTLWSSKPSQL